MGSPPHSRKFSRSLPLLASMGEVIQLHERRARRSVAAAPRERFRATFYFDLSCPFTYLAAERIERAFDEVVWLPASDGALRRSCLAGDDVAAASVRRAAEERAAELRMPLVWPERYPTEVAAAMRVAALAQGSGRGAAFVLAATRLAFCGGFDLDDPEILAEAAAAAGVAGAGAGAGARRGWAWTRRAASACATARASTSCARSGARPAQSRRRRSSRACAK